MYKNAGNENAKRILDHFLDAMIKSADSYRGNLIKTIGDEIMLSFDRCQDCLHYAFKLQSDYNEPLSQNELSLSIGIGFGEIISEKNDIFGEAVNDAAYLTHVAKGGQILLAESFYTHLSMKDKISIREFDRVTIKGARESSIIYRAFWHHDEISSNETQLMSANAISRQLQADSLQINYRGQSFSLTSEAAPFLIGRDKDKCHLAISGEQISRQHCRINFSRGKFVLVDHSTNGCYIFLGSDKEIYLRREEYPITSNTRVSLGGPFDETTESVELIIHK